MKRRDFLKTTAAAAVASNIGPAFVHAEDKAGTKKAIIGQGEHRYECVHDWGQLPSNLKWQTTHGVAVDAAGLVYIKYQGYAGQPPADTIVVFDPTGKFVRSFGKEYYGGGHGIDVRKEIGEEFLYLSDVHNRQVVKTNLKGEHVWERTYPKEANVYKDSQGYRPTNVAFAPDGGFYVGDGYGSSYVHQYDKDAKWIRTWGGNGQEPGKMRTPHGLWLDDRPGRTPSLIVADRANARLQYFTLDGKFISLLSDVSFPAHFDIRGDVLMVPDLHARVTLFDRDNKVLMHLGEDRERILADKKFTIRRNPKEWRAGKFIHPHDACFDKEGNIFVVEWVEPGRVTFLKRVS